MKKQALLKAKSYHYIVPLNKGPDKDLGLEGSQCQ